MDDEIKSEDKI